MAEENLWKKLAFEVDLEKQEAKEIKEEGLQEEKPLGEQEALKETQQENLTEEQKTEEERKRPSRTERLRRQRDQERIEKEALRNEVIRLTEQLQKGVKETDDLLRTSTEMTKTALEGKREQAQQAFMDAFEKGDKEALLKAQTAMTQAEVDLREVMKATPPERKEEPKPKPVAQPQTNEPSERVQEWVEANPAFLEDDEFRGAAMGIEAKLRKEGYAVESDELFAEMDKRLAARGFKVSGQEKKEEKPKKLPPVESGRSSGGRIRLTVTEEDESTARRLGVPLDKYMLEKAKVDSAGFDPNRRDNNYVTIF